METTYTFERRPIGVSGIIIEPEAFAGMATILGQYEHGLEAGIPVQGGTLHGTLLANS